VTVPVLTAVTGASWEAALVAGLERTPTGITVVRRCVDLADLLAAAATGTARAALLSAELRRLDRDALSRLAAAHVAVVGLYSPGDEQAETRLRQLGVVHVLSADAPPADIAAAVSAALGEQAVAADDHSSPAWSRPMDGLPDRDAPVAAEPVVEPGTGRLVAVWGPTGAPGRTTVAVGVATELAATGTPTLLADADVYGGVVAQVLGFLDEAPGLAAAARLANNGQLDVPALAGVAVVAAPDLRVLTGISRADRWPELRPAALDQVWELSRSLAAVTVVDLGFCLEQDEELSFDTAAPRRNGATVATLLAADVVLAIGSADPVGMQRLVRGITALREAAPGVLPRVVVNRVRRGAVGAEPEAQLAEALERYAGVRDIAFVPDDRDALDASLLQARPLRETSPDSAARRALAGIAAGLVGRPTPRRKRGLLRRGA
jgi:MinD-like ATPase involved in chromosome partitioning or flagellar assembly/DNA-binding NarL/FixJ family response regulator